MHTCMLSVSARSKPKSVEILTGSYGRFYLQSVQESEGKSEDEFGVHEPFVQQVMGLKILRVHMRQ